MLKINEQKNKFLYRLIAIVPGIITMLVILCLFILLKYAYTTGYSEFSMILLTSFIRVVFWMIVIFVFIQILFKILLWLIKSLFILAGGILCVILMLGIVQMLIV